MMRAKLRSEPARLDGVAATMASRRFIQCDVFSPTPILGNALAVVVEAQGLSDEAMQRFAAWTNLAETTFLVSPDDPRADYRVRIFTPTRELWPAASVDARLEWPKGPDGKPMKPSRWLDR